MSTDSVFLQAKKQVPVSSVPVGSVPVGSVPVNSVPVSSVPVGSYLNAAVLGMSNTNCSLTVPVSSLVPNGLLPERLTLHEVVSTIQRVGYILRKINYNRHTDCVNEIRSLVTAILIECEFLQPQQALYEPMKIITPCLWYWAISNNDITLELPDFHTIYCYEGLLLKSFLQNCTTFVIPECKSFNALLQTLENYYKTVRPHANNTQLHYKIQNSVLQWRKETDHITEEQKQENKIYTEDWLVKHNTLLVEVPDLPTNWAQKDPITRPVFFDEALEKYKNSEAFLALDKNGLTVPGLFTSEKTPKNTDVTNITVRSPSAPTSFTYYSSSPSGLHSAKKSISSAREVHIITEPVRSINFCESPSVQSVSDHDGSIFSPSIKSVSVSVSENLYDSSATFKWSDTINQKNTNVIIARNKTTGQLEISEQIFNGMLPYLAEIIVQYDGVVIKK